MKPKTVLERAKSLFGPEGKNWISGAWVREESEGANPKLNFCLTGAVGATVLPREEGESISDWNSRLSSYQEYPKEAKVAICALAEATTGNSYDPEDAEDFLTAFDSVIDFNDDRDPVAPDEYKDIKEALERAIKNLS